MATWLTLVNFWKVAGIAVTMLILSLAIFLPELFFLENGVYNYAFSGVIMIMVLLLLGSIVKREINS